MILLNYNGNHHSLLLKVFSDSHFLQIKSKFLSMKYQAFLANLLLKLPCILNSQQPARNQMFHAILYILSLTSSSLVLCVFSIFF